MSIKTFSTSCRKYTNHQANINECATCRYCTDIKCYCGTVNCTYDEEPEKSGGRGGGSPPQKQKKECAKKGVK